MHSIRSKLACLSLATLAAVCLSSSVSADVTVSTEEGAKRVFKLSVTPAAESAPLFRHRLTVEPHNTIPGNAATYYLRSYCERGLRGRWEHGEKTYGDEVFKWYEIDFPISSLPLKKVREFSDLFDSYVESFIQKATLCRDCEWGLAEEDLRGLEVLSTPIPSVQESRMIARALAIRARCAIAEKRYDDAVDNLRMTYQLGQNVAKMEFLVCSLVGIAEVRMANDCMIDLIAAPNSPNMYWGLAELKRPIVSIRNAARLDLTLAARLAPLLLAPEEAKRSSDGWNAEYVEIFKSLRTISDYSSNGSNKGSSWEPGATAFALAGIGAAKKRLIQSGLETAEVEAMPVGQVMILDAASDIRYFSNRLESILYVPYGDAQKLGKEIDLEMDAASRELRLGASLVNTYAPAIQQVQQAELRADRRVCALQVIESLRRHAAVSGEFPETLDQLHWPAPKDPITESPFDYKRVNGQAIIDVSFPKSPSHSYRFEITLTEAKK